MAEQVVGDVPERQHRETEVLESLRLTADRFPEQGGVIGELAVAEGRRDRDEVRGRLQVGDVDLVEFDRLDFDAEVPSVSVNVIAASSALPISVP